MNSDDFKSCLIFTKSQRAGLVALMAVIILTQLAYHFIDFALPESNPVEKKQWLAMQSEIDSLNTQQQQYVVKIYPFNPNFITDFKGYKLGMSVAQIDRLLAFRKQNKFVNSAAEFQKVTRIPDSLLAAMSPYFKFPDWVKNKKAGELYPKRPDKKEIAIIDINAATQEDLKKVYGIGDGLSERILREKEKFGEFVSMEQMKDIWGLSPEVVQKLNESFKIMKIPDVKKIRINEASIKDLQQLPYFRYQLAKSIVTFRSMNGTLKNADDLLKISGFPVEKVKIIALYLEF